ncbi:MAG: hypothetical protein ACP5N3_02760 [Candidatus Nanoarchaeia archaeon]
MAERVIVDIEKFVLFHNDRISLLKEFAEKKSNGRLIYQISFLGFESLAKILFPEEKSSAKRFKSLLAISFIGIEAEQLYDWRCSLFHQGFIHDTWTTLEGWSEYDVAFLSYPENKFRSSVEYPPESIIGIYQNLVLYVAEYFKRNNTKTIEF